MTLASASAIEAAWVKPVRGIGGALTSFNLVASRVTTLPSPSGSSVRVVPPGVLWERDGVTLSVHSAESLE